MPTSAPAAAPPQAPCRVVRLVLVDVDLALVVLGDDCGVVGADRPDACRSFTTS